MFRIKCHEKVSASKVFIGGVWQKAFAIKNVRWEVCKLIPNPGEKAPFLQPSELRPAIDFSVRPALQDWQCDYLLHAIEFAEPVHGPAWQQ